MNDQLIYDTVPNADELREKFSKYSPIRRFFVLNGIRGSALKEFAGKKPETKEVLTYMGQRLQDFIKQHET